MDFKWIREVLTLKASHNSDHMADLTKVFMRVRNYRWDGPDHNLTSATANIHVSSFTANIK